MTTTTDRMEQALQAWGCWLAGGTRGAGYPTKSVLHESWLPPQPGMTPTLATSGPSDARERVLHGLIQQLSQREQDTLVVVYVKRIRPTEQAQWLGCAASTVRVRLATIKRTLTALNEPQ